MKKQESLLNHTRKFLNFIQTMMTAFRNFIYVNMQSGKIGTGNGPEIQNKELYKGTFEPLIINKEKIEEINLVPEEIKKIILSKEVWHEKALQLFFNKTRWNQILR